MRKAVAGSTTGGDRDYVSWHIKMAERHFSCRESQFIFKERIKRLNIHKVLGGNVCP